MFINYLMLHFAEVFFYASCMLLVNHSVSQHKDIFLHYNAPSLGKKTIEASHLLITTYLRLSENKSLVTQIHPVLKLHSVPFYNLGKMHVL